MSLKKLSTLFFIAAFVFVAASCDKDEDSTTTPSLTGLTFDCPKFVNPDHKVTLTPKGVTQPDGVNVKYYWRVTPTMTQYDTVDVFTHQFTDTLQTCTVNCYAYASGYTGASFSREVVVVKGGIDGSLKGRGINAADPKVTVDGEDYYYEKIGNLEWFRNNLSKVGQGTPYLNSNAISNVFGRYYSYNEALAACPEGWRLPTEEDWMSLAAEVGSPVAEKYSVFENVASKLFADATFNGTQILQYWPEVGEITNSSKLSLVPLGFSNLGSSDANGAYPYASFDGVFEYAVVWTADKSDEDGMAYYRYLFHNLPDMFVGKGDVDTFGASVRCVRDAK